MWRRSNSLAPTSGGVHTLLFHCLVVLYCDFLQCRCPHCKKDVEATKQMHLWRSSDILVVYLKRFGVSDHGVRSRLNTFVDVPLGEVDFSLYFAPDSPFRDQNNRYRLYAVSNHTGGSVVVMV
jgi:ubiquitin C-terminal hydrolase